MPRRIDLNADVGELPEALLDGREEALIATITSANIACGGHAGNRHSMAAVLGLCMTHGVAIGAHPSYPDPAHFGRVSMPLTSAEIEKQVSLQVEALAGIVAAAGASLTHVKPHGALYNDAARDERIATAIARGVKAVDPKLLLVGLAGSRMLLAWQREEVAVAGEAFADRRYEPDGSLRSRQHGDACIDSVQEAADQALRIVEHNSIVASDGTRFEVDARTLCIHGDGPNALAIATAVRARLHAAGVVIESLASAR